jgi:hypothetical protein
MKKWSVLILIAILVVCFAGCDTGSNTGTNSPPYGNTEEQPFTGFTSVSSVDAHLQLYAQNGESPDDPVQLSVKISASELSQLFGVIFGADKFVALDISHCYDVRERFEYRMVNYGDKIVSVVLPNGITIIGSNVFADCASLEQITLPASLTSIWSYVFYDCTSLTRVNCLATTPPTLPRTGAMFVFYNTSANLSIQVPPASVAAYKTAWSDYADRITGY